MIKVIIKNFVIFYGITSFYFSAFSSVLEPGTPAPTFSLPSLEGKRESLRIWCGNKLIKPYINKTPHIVIISFWATYCKPCQKEIPELENFYKKNKDKNIKIFLISIDDKGASVVAPFAKEQNYTLPILFDPFKKTAERYGVKVLPALFVLDTKGIIRYSSVGFNKNVSLEDILENVVSSITNGLPINSESTKGETAEIKNRSEKIQINNSNYQKFTPKQKWQAVAKIECGIPPDTIANRLNIPIDELKKWYSDLKKAAIMIWKPQR